MLIVRGFGSEEANALLNLINHQQDMDKIYRRAKDLFEAKYQLLINKREKVGLKHYNDPKAFINIQAICRMSKIILKSTTYEKYVKY